ncbi:Uncharacterized protein FKW44_000467 [Caligus rogercresseyi]|uniref:Uncharacterized protein n=1 Tax=Caligus rogercresseyi TaxID=217165 RepID=A0A7T8KHI8_CALRO|nr:Uncharacterized protein FKW44_000467 [Caligus rogercresseyi]
MAKTLCGLKLAELRNLCVELELVEGVEELEGKKKSEVVVLVREYLIACGCDPKTHKSVQSLAQETPPPFASAVGVSQPSPFVMSGSNRGHRWASWMDEFSVYIFL